MLLVAPVLAFGQVKGKKSKKAFKTSKGTEFKVGDVVTLGKASNKEKFAYVYVNKSMFSIGNIVKAVKTVKDVKNLDVNNVKNISNTLNKVSEIANSELVNKAMSQLMSQAVSESYVTKNALSKDMAGSKFKIKYFKIYTDKDTGDKVVHAIAKGNGKKVAILLEFAEKTKELASK